MEHIVYGLRLLLLLLLLHGHTPAFDRIKLKLRYYLPLYAYGALLFECFTV